MALSKCLKMGVIGALKHLFEGEVSKRKNVSVLKFITHHWSKVEKLFSPCTSPQSINIPLKLQGWLGSPMALRSVL